MLFDDFSDGEVRFDFTDLDFYLVTNFGTRDDDYIPSFDAGNPIALFSNILNFHVSDLARLDWGLRFAGRWGSGVRLGHNWVACSLFDECDSIGFLEIDRAIFDLLMRDRDVIFSVSLLDFRVEQTQQFIRDLQVRSLRPSLNGQHP